MTQQERKQKLLEAGFSSKAAENMSVPEYLERVVAMLDAGLKTPPLTEEQKTAIRNIVKSS